MNDTVQVGKMTTNQWSIPMKSPAKSVFETILIVAVVLAFALMPLVTKAETHQKHSPPPLSEFDKDGDGFISEEEFDSTRAARMAAMAEAGKPMKGAATAPTFSDIDTDGDGRVSEAELTTAQHAHMKAMRDEQDGGCKGMGKGKSMPTFADLDTNGDGCISTEEFAAHQATHHRHGRD
jgi:hypothetical protein